MYHFEVHVQPRPPVTIGGTPYRTAGSNWPTLVFESPTIRGSGGPTFDGALAALARLPRMYVEPDGSFLWQGKEGELRWQVDGNLYDQGESLAYVSLKGECPVIEFEELIQCFRWPAVELVFQFVRLGVIVDEATFRKLAVVLPK
jgi:hypothetical protein